MADDFGALNAAWPGAEQEADENLAAVQRAQEPSGFSTFWQAIKHPSLYPMIKGLMQADEAPKAAPGTMSPESAAAMPDIGEPLIPSGPQISSGTKLGNAIANQLPKAVVSAIGSGLTAPGDAMAGKIPLYDQDGNISPEMISRALDTAGLAGGVSAAGTVERGAATAGRDLRVLGHQVLASDSAAPGAALAVAEHAPQYVTGIETALDKIPSKELTGQQWLNQLKRYGAKPEELDHRELTPAFEAYGNQKIPRQAIEDHLTATPMQLNVSEKSTKPWHELSPEQQYKIKELSEEFNYHRGYNETPQQYYESAARENTLPDGFGDVPRYPEYQHPGGENYRERLVTLPPKEPKSYGLFSANGERVAPHMTFDDQHAAYNWAGEARYPNAEREALIPKDANVKQLTGHDYLSNHWPNDPNVIFHRRSTDHYFDDGVKSLHDLENQSDWHQEGRDKGYGNPDEVRDRGEATITPSEDGRRFHVRFPDGHERVTASEVGARLAATEDRFAKAGKVPDAPFKGTGWERLALHDQLREAAEKGYPRISWTAGEENTTNPMVMLRKADRDLSEFPPERQAAFLKADKGIRDYYNRRRVDAANKIGKMHGVQVEKSSLPINDGLSGTEATPRLLTYHMDIPDSLRQELLTKPMSLFEDSSHGAAASVASHIGSGEGNVARELRPGGGGGAGGLEEAQRTAARVAGAVKPLEGLPNKPIQLSQGAYVPGPNEAIHQVAKQYMESTGRPYERVDRYHPIDKAHAEAIANAYEEMLHAPNDPKVRASYQAMAEETKAQYQALKKSGLKIDAIEPGMKDPYAESPRLAQKDVAENNHLWFFPTESGFGTEAPGRGHPLLMKSGEKLGDRELLNNDLFRIVHDYFGHMKEGNGFRAAGEDNAWRTHAKMYSDLARPAMTTETRGQNSWLNYGPHGEFNRTASAADTHYAQQKVGLLPEWTMRDRETPGQLSPLEHDLTVNDILHKDTPAQPPGSRNVEQIAADLDQRGQNALRKLGVNSGRIEESMPHTDEILSRAMANEIKQAMDRGGNTATDWYRGKVENAMKIAQEIHPELADPHQRMGYTLGLAVTSQGEKVRPNTRLADQVYNHFKQTGRFPTDVKSKNGPAMNGNFAKLNDLLDKVGPEGTREFLDRDFTVRELKQLGYNVGSSEQMDTKVKGSTILGSKIGGGFYQNLNGNFDPVTMDLWFMRGWGRLTGTLVGNPEAMPKQVEKLRDLLKADRKKAPLDPDKLAEIAEQIRLAHERDFRENRALYDSGEKKKSELTNASIAYLKNHSGINEQPSSGGHRQWIRKVVNRAREILEQHHGVKMSNADLQATWWYPEKELYGKLGGKMKAEDVNVDYETALRELRDEKRGSDAQKQGEGALPAVARQPGRGAPDVAGGIKGSGRGGQKAARQEVDFGALDQ